MQHNANAEKTQITSRGLVLTKLKNSFISDEIVLSAVNNSVVCNLNVLFSSIQYSY